MSQENKIEAEKPSPTTDFLPSDGASCSAWVEVSKDDFDQYISDYPKPLGKDIARMCEPPMLTYNDFSDGKVWPQSIVAKVQLYDGSEYHGGRGPVYSLTNSQINE